MTEAAPLPSRWIGWGYRVRRYWNALLLAAVVLIGAGCDLRVATEIVVESDYSGELVVSIALDEETAADLIGAGLVPDQGLVDAVTRAPGWTVAPIEGVTASARLTHPFDHVDEVGGLLSSLGASLGPEDGLLWDGLRMRVDVAGDVILEGRAGLVPPTVAGAVGDGVTFDGEDLARLLEEQGRQAVRHDLRVTSSGRPGANDADVTIRNALVWELPVGRLEEVSAVLPVTASMDTARLVAAGLLAAVATAVVTLLTRRRAKA